MFVYLNGFCSFTCWILFVNFKVWTWFSNCKFLCILYYMEYQNILMRFFHRLWVVNMNRIVISKYEQNSYLIVLCLSFLPHIHIFKENRVRWRLKFLKTTCVMDYGPPTVYLVPSFNIWFYTKLSINLWYNQIE